MIRALRRDVNYRFPRRRKQLSRYWCRVLGLVLVPLVVASCAKDTHNSSQSFANYQFHASSVAKWPIYLAKDYQSSPNRSLTSGDVALIRKTLTLVKPCQRATLTYAFPSSPRTVRFVLFLPNTNTAWPHVLWTQNKFFKPDSGLVFSALGKLPYSQSDIRYDVAHASCD